MKVKIAVEMMTFASSGVNLIVISFLPPGLIMPSKNEKVECNLPFLGVISKLQLSELSSCTSKFTIPVVGLTIVNDLVCDYWTAQYSKSTPTSGMESIIFDKL